MREIDLLRLELLKVSSESPPGSHFEVARRVGITPDSELKIRQAKRCKTDTKKNRETMKKIIHTYKVLNNEVSNTINL